MIKKVFLSLIIFLSCNHLFAQNEEKELIQFSGVVVTADSLHPIPFVSIIIKDTYRGTISDYYGFFSFVARLNDTIIFSSVGFKKAMYVIPDTLADNRYSLIQALMRDTVEIHEAVIYPWPTREQFRQAFVNLNLPDDDLNRAKRNLAKQRLMEVAENLPTTDASMSYKYQMQQQYSRLYSVGQLPLNNLLNPISWAQFIQAWKNGDFKNKDKYEKE
ncbi:MAG: carboxypeptidase-like regulatory domain-containing protein [Bacteroidia bacterium]